MTTTLRSAAEILAEARETGETISGPRVADASFHLVSGDAVFAVSDETEGEQVVGYTWATYATADDLLEGEYAEHDGGLTEADLVEAIARFRAAQGS